MHEIICQLAKVSERATQRVFLGLFRFFFVVVDLINHFGSKLSLQKKTHSGAKSYLRIWLNWARKEVPILRKWQMSAM